MPATTEKRTHDAEDEFFCVVSEDRTVDLRPGQAFVVPKGVVPTGDE